MKRILLIDDETGLRTTVRDRLSAEGYEVVTASDGTMGSAKLKGEQYDLALLDCMLPDRPGIDILREYRKENGRKPVIMLTAKSTLEDKLAGLCTGADDYITKPFDFGELIARIETSLRRISPDGDAVPAEDTEPLVPDLPNFHFGPFELAYHQGTLLKAGKRVELSLQEYKLLSYLTRHHDELVRNDALLEKLWDYGANVSSSTVYTHISWLRKKLKTPDRPEGYIRTVRGIGYLFSA